MEILLWILFAFGALYALDQLGLWMEARGWLYYRKKKRTGSASSIFTGGDVFDPGTRHLETALEERVLEDEDDGDDDGRRTSGDRIS